MSKSVKLAIMSLFVFFIAGPVFATCSWKVDPVSAPHLILGTSPDNLALMSNGNPAIAYGGDGLYLAHFSGTEWVIETLDHAGSVGANACLKYDSAGNGHIVYEGYKEAHEHLIKYMKQDGNAWISMDAPEVNSSPAFGMDLDSNGDCWIAYYDENLQKVFLAHDDGSGNWVTESVLQSVVGISSLELLMDGMEYVIVASISTNGDDYHLVMAYGDSSAHDVEVIDIQSNTGHHLDCALAQDGKINMSYWDAGNKKVKYVSILPGTPAGTPGVLDDQQEEVHAISICLHPTTDIPTVFYSTEATQSSLVMAVTNGTIWTKSVILTGPEPFTDLSVDTPANSVFNLSFFDESSHLLKYADITSGTAEITMIDRSLQFSGPCESTVNSTGNLSILYFDRIDHTLQLASESTGQWSSSTLPNVNDYPYSLSMAINPVTDKLGVSWYSQNDYVLQYMTETASGWQLKSLSSVDLVNGSVSCLKYLSNGSPVLFYTDAQNAVQSVRKAGDYWLEKTIVTEAVKTLSVALTDEDRVSIAYKNQDNALKHSRELSDDWWNTETVASDMGISGNVLLQLNPLDEPHIVYCASATSEIMHSWSVADSWHTETVASSVGPDMPLAFHIDALGMQTVAWWDDDSSSLQSARGSSNNWNLGVVDAQDSLVITDLEITSDPINRVNIAYDNFSKWDICLARYREDVWYNLGMPRTTVSAGDQFLLTRNIHNTTASNLSVDEYLILDVYGAYWFAPEWTQTPQSSKVSLPANRIDYEVPFDFAWPTGAGSAHGIYFWGGIIDALSQVFLDYDMVEFGWNE